MTSPVHVPGNKSDRYHALDALRGVMMLLGVVLHAAVTYMRTPVGPWPLKDESTSVLFDLMVYLIHLFRIPVFFVMSGFFGAMLLESRGLRAMLVHRMRRIAIPFALFWPPLFLLTAPLTIAGWQRTQSGAWGPLDLSYFQARPDAPWLNTLHLWFLYYLVIFYLLVPIVQWFCSRIPPRIRDTVLNISARLLTSPGGPPLLAIPAILTGIHYPHGMVEITGSFRPDLPQLIYHGSFFTVGFFLWYRRDVLERLQNRRRSLLALAGLAALTTLGAEEWLRMNPLRDPQAANWIRCIAVNMATWWAISAVTGWFLAHCSRPSARFRWLTDSAYWVYLVHLPVTIAISLPLLDWSGPAAVKFLINVTLTSLVCLISYDRLIRNGRLGELLNGRRYPRGFPAVEPE